MNGKSKTKKYPTKGKRVYKRRNPVKNRNSIAKVVQKVLTNNMEKKRYDVTYAATDFTMGQVAGNSTAFFASQFTPIPSLGTNAGTRVGNEIAITGMYMTVQLRQMSAATVPVKVQFYLVQFKGDYQLSPQDAVIALFNTTEYIGGGATVYDTNSSRNVDYMNTYRILKRFTMYCKGDQLSGQNIPTSKNVGLKFPKPLKVRYFASGTGIASGRLMLFAFASNGNASTTTVSTLTNCPVTAINTGQYINYNAKFYYNDA